MARHLEFPARASHQTTPPSRTEPAGPRQCLLVAEDDSEARRLIDRATAPARLTAMRSQDGADRLGLAAKLPDSPAAAATAGPG